VANNNGNAENGILFVLFSVILIVCVEYRLIAFVDFYNNCGQYLKCAFKVEEAIDCMAILSFLICVVCVIEWRYQNNCE